MTTHSSRGTSRSAQADAPSQDAQTLQPRFESDPLDTAFASSLQRSSQSSPTAPAEGRPELAAQRTLGNAIRNSPRVLAQRRQLGGMFGAAAKFNAASAPRSAVVQRYFEIDGTKTNEDSIYPEEYDNKGEKIELSESEKDEFVWKYFLVSALDKAKISAELRAESKRNLLNKAKSGAEESLSGVLKTLKRVADYRDANEVPLEERDSPKGMEKLSHTPELEGKEKHSRAVYKRGESAKEESFDSDSYTKGPARRREENPTTPKGAEQQTWTAKQVKEIVAIWSGKTPLARHLAGQIWPLLKNSEEGRKWELKFREMDRLVELRASEAQSSSITIIRNRDGASIKILERDAYTVKARQLLRKAIVDGTKHPADQQEVLFYDQLLKKDVGEEVQDTSTTVFSLKAGYTAAGPGLSMLLTHWRPILFFDWILAEDVLNNAT